MSCIERRSRDKTQNSNDVNEVIQNMLKCLLNHGDKKCNACREVDACSLVLEAVMVCRSRRCYDRDR